MANICFVPLDQFDCESIELVEVVAGVGYFPRLVSQPSNHFQDTLEISSLFFLRIGVVVSEIALAVVVCSITKVHKDRLGMSDVEVTIGFRRETGPDSAASRRKVGITELGVDLRVSTWLVKVTKEALLEYGPLRRGRLCGFSLVFGFFLSFLRGAFSR